MITRPGKRWAVIGFVAVFGLMSFMVATPSASADQEVAEVVAVKYSAWASRVHQSVKTTLRVGDLLYQGDVVEVFANNYVDIAFDKSGENVVHIEGPASLAMTNIKDVDINLKKGQLFAFLDNQQGKQFLVTTPTAVSAVRGTHFQVKSNGGVSETLVYKGRVEMFGRTAWGEKKLVGTMISAGEKSKIMAANQDPGSLTPLAPGDEVELTSITAKVESGKKELEKAGFQSRIGEDIKEPIIKATDEPATRTKGPKDGSIVY